MDKDRYMHEKAQDALRYCQIYNKPDLFMTVTANKKWPEIQRELQPGQTPEERQDIIARVFNQKVNKIKEALFKYGVFGKRVANMHTIEWQKK